MISDICKKFPGLNSFSGKTDFAQRLVYLTKELNISQKELADRAEIKKRALDMYLGYQRSMPPADVACRLARVLNTSVEWLCYGVAE